MRAQATSKRKPARDAPGRFAIILEDARRAGLLDGDRSEHLSFRALPALIEAARH